MAQPAPRSADPGRQRYARHGDLLRIDGPMTGHDSPAWSVREYLRLLPDAMQLPETRRRSWWRYVLWPNLVLDVYPDQTVVQQILPVSSAETLVRETAYALPEGGREARLARYLNRRVRRRFEIVDRRVREAARVSPSEGQADLEILEWAFAPETVAGNPEVARILAAVPELEGTICWQTRVARFTRLALPESCTQFPPRTAAPFVVVVAQAGAID